LLYLTVFINLVAGLEIDNEIENNRPLRILVHSPTFGYSHVQFQGKLADLLVESGHDVDFFIPNWTPSERRNGTMKANVIKFNATTYTQYHEMDFFKDPFKAENVILNTDRANPYINCTLQFCTDLVNHPTILQEMKNRNYDVMIGEIFDPCIFFAAESLGIRIKIISSAISLPDEIATSHGFPIPRSYIPSILSSGATVPHLSWTERALNILIDVYHPILMGKLTEQMRELYKTKFNIELPSFHEILRSSSYVFVNVHDHFDNPRPITRKIHYIGGIAIKKPVAVQLPYIETIFQQSVKGVILFSMGTLVDTKLMPLEIKTALIRTLARFPQYNVIWRFHPSLNDSQLLAHAPNIYTVDWVDQTTILNDPRTKLFLSHCGQNSAIEAAYSGTPVLALPLFADQNYNAALLIRRGMGIYQNVRQIDEEELARKISKMLNDPSYVKNGKKLARKLQDEPFKPEERFVRLVEYAARHRDTGDLDLHVTKLNFIIRNNLDIYLPAATSVLLILYIFSKISKLLLKIALYFAPLKQKVE